MNTIKINRRKELNDNVNLSFKKMFGKYEADENGITRHELVIVLEKDVPLNAGEFLSFSRIIKDERALISEYITGNYKIIKKAKDDNGDTNLVLPFPERSENYVKSIKFPGKIGDPYIIVLKNNINIVQNDIDIQNQKIYFSDEAPTLANYPAKLWGNDFNFHYNDKCVVNKDKVYIFVEEEGKSMWKATDEKYDPDKKYGNNIEILATDLFNDKYKIDQFSLYNDDNYDIKSPVYSIFLDRNELYCYDFDTDIVQNSKIKITGSDFLFLADKETEEYVLPYRYKDEKKIMDGNIFYSNSIYSFPVFIPEKTSSSLLKEERINKELIEELFQDVIPDYIDMEKSSFEPYYDNNGVLEKVNEIIINPHFRERTLEGWNTSDILYWECSDDGNFEGKEIDDVDADSMYSLNFMPEDILNKKNKVGKSFFRISIYDSNNPLKQILLYYSTIFLDVNEMYSILIKNREEILNGKIDDVYKKNAIEKYKEEIKCTTSIKNRNFTDNSSEGFYIYMFSDNFKNDERDIYMKIEFNHAGVGKTIPLMQPFKDGKEYVPTFPPKNFVILDAETKEKNIDMQKYFSYLYIPLKARYDEGLGKYIYIFPKNMVDKNGVARLNIFEPRINPEENAAQK